MGPRILEARRRDAAAMKWPLIEAEDGQLTDDYLEALGAVEFTPERAARFLAFEVVRLAQEFGIGSVCASTGRGSVAGRACRCVQFTTRGLSSADALMQILIGHYWVRYLYVKWTRPGHYYFEIPMGLLEETLSDAELARELTSSRTVLAGRAEETAPPAKPVVNLETEGLYLLIGYALAREGDGLAWLRDWHEGREQAVLEFGRFLALPPDRQVSRIARSRRAALAAV